MKITIFGLTLSSSWGNGHATPYRALLRALAAKGHQITFLEKDVPYYAARRDFSGGDFCRLELYSSWEQIRAQALATAAESDVVITASYCPQGALINDDVLVLRRPLRVFYDLDTPLTVAALDAGGVDYLRSSQMREFDLYLSFTGSRILPELKQRWGVRRARPLYGCVDPDVHYPAAPWAEYACHLSYLGTYALDRQQKLDALFLEAVRRSPRNRFVLAGSLYPSPWSWPANLLHFDHLAPAEHSALFSSSRLTLNITRAEMARWGYCPSGRFFEAAACGCPLITDEWDGLESFFSPEDEILLARNTDDVLAAMQRPETELRQMALRARARTLDEHTGKRRAQQLLAYLDEATASPAQSISSRQSPDAVTQPPEAESAAGSAMAS